MSSFSPFQTSREVRFGNTDSFAARKIQPDVNLSDFTVIAWPMLTHSASERAGPCVTTAASSVSPFMTEDNGQEKGFQLPLRQWEPERIACASL